MSIDIVLINPNDRKQVYQHLAEDLSGIEPPTFTLLVAQYLRQKGLSVAVIDQGPFNLTPEGIAQEVEYLNPTLVGVYVYGYQPSASTQNMPAARRICQAIKNRTPEVPIMISGTHMAALPERTLLEEPVDFVCDREGFETPYWLVKFWQQRGTMPINLRQHVPDCWFHEMGGVKAGGRSTFTHRGRLLTQEEMDAIGMPAWDLVEHNGKLDHYRCHNWHAFNTGDRAPYASMYTSFGCPYKCHFCCINAPFGDMMKGPRPYRLFSPEVTVNQIKHLVEHYGIRNIKFVDEMFVLNPQHVFGITDGLTKEGLGDLINIWAYARVDTAKPQFLEPLKKAGFNWLCLGIECGNRDVREAANKMKLDEDDISNVVKRIYDAGIYIIGNYIFGLPEDSIDHMQQTYDLAVELNCEFANFYSAMAYPGSPLHYVEGQKFELPATWEGYSQHGYETFPLRNEYVTNAQILKFRDEKHLEYHSRPEYQKMVLEKFSQRALDEINLMLSKGKPKRKILGD